MTAALNGSWYSNWAAEDTSVITEECLKRFSFINVMAYDMNNDAHSPIWFFEKSISYWLFRGLPPEKIVMGMPLYAKPSWLQYRNLVALNPEYAYSDFAPTTPLESNYNGINTLREKTVIALNRAIGASVEYDEGNSAVNVIKGETTIRISINNKIFFINEKKVEMDTVAVLIDQRVYIPLRSVFEAFGYKVEWHENSRTVILSDD